MGALLSYVIVLTCGAQVVTYSNRAAFDAAVPSAIVEAFESDFNPGLMRQSFDNFDVVENNSVGVASVNWRPGDCGPESPTCDGFLTSGALGFTWSNTDPADPANDTVTSDLTFEFDFPIRAFAADIIDFGTVPDSGDFVADAFLGGTPVFSNQIAAILLAVPSDFNERGNEQFFGVQTTAPFDRLVFVSTGTPLDDLIIFDDVAISAVPEPGAVVMMLALCNVCGLISFYRRRIAQHR